MIYDICIYNYNYIYRKASVRLGSFRFVETSNRGGSVHQWPVRFGSRDMAVRFVLCSVAGREVFDRMGSGGDSNSNSNSSSSSSLAVLVRILLDVFLNLIFTARKSFSELFWQKVEKK